MVKVVGGLALVLATVGGIGCSPLTQTGATRDVTLVNVAENPLTSDAIDTETILLRVGGSDDPALQLAAYNATLRALRAAGCRVVTEADASADAIVLVTAGAGVEVLGDPDTAVKQRGSVVLSTLAGNEIVDQLAVQFVAINGAVDDASVSDLSQRWYRRVRVAKLLRRHLHAKVD